MVMAVALIRGEIERIRSAIDANNNEIEGLQRNVQRLQDLSEGWVREIDQLSRDYVTLSGSAVPERLCRA